MAAVAEQTATRHTSHLNTEAYVGCNTLTQRNTLTQQASWQKQCRRLSCKALVSARWCL